MKSIVRKSLAAAAALSTTLAPMATQFTAVSAARAGAVAAVGSIAVLAPADAYAQSGKRMCGTIWSPRTTGSGWGRAAFGMEVSKYDVVTCTGLIGAWVGITVMPGGARALVQSLMNNTANVGYGVVGNIRMMETCESFSSNVGSRVGNVCLRMQDYKLYAFASVPGSFGMTKL